MFYLVLRQSWDMRGTRNESPLQSVKGQKMLWYHYDRDHDEDNDNCSNWFSFCFILTAEYAISVDVE